MISSSATWTSGGVYGVDLHAGCRALADGSVLTVWLALHRGVVVDRGRLASDSLGGNKASTVPYHTDC